MLRTLLCLCLLSSPALAITITGTAIRVADGDTVTVHAGPRDEKIRLLGIDTPEKAQIPWGPRAKEFTSRLVLGKAVRVETDVQPRDKYGRLLGYLYVGKTFVNLELLKQGYAMLYTYPPNVAHTDEFVAAQRSAREKGLNIWAADGGLSQTPYEFRHGKPAPADRGQSGLRAKATPVPPGSTSGAWVGSKTTKKFHQPGCQYAEKIAPENQVRFGNAQEAEQAGFKPCRACGK